MDGINNQIGEDKIFEKEELSDEKYFPKCLRCSDGVVIPETARNWEAYLTEPEKFQENYILRVKRYLDRE